MDTKKIKQIIALFEESKISSMDLEIDDIKIKLEKQTAPVQVQSVAAPQVVAAPVAAPAQVESAAQPKEEAKDYLKSPLVGTFYASGSQGGKAFVEVGSKVKEGDVVCIIEAMKVMNEIKAHRSGVISEIKVNDGDMVQFDQELMAIGE